MGLTCASYAPLTSDDVLYKCIRVYYISVSVDFRFALIARPAPAPPGDGIKEEDLPGCAKDRVCFVELCPGEPF